MEQKRIYLAEANRSISKWLESTFGMKLVPSLQDADLVVFPGGLDVNPDLYNEPAGQRTSFNRDTDAEWVAIYKSAIKSGKKVMGICKGSQFVTVMSGGSLFQHVSSHAILGDHTITVEDKVYEVASTHHQMMNPFILNTSDFDILAFSTERRSEIYLNGFDDEVEFPSCEPEAVFYRGNGTLAIQFHPEFRDFNAPINKEIEKWLENMFAYTITDFSDKYNKHINYEKLQKSTVTGYDLGSVSPEVLEEFISTYLK